MSACVLTLDTDRSHRRPVQLPQTRRRALEALRDVDHGEGATPAEWQRASGLVERTFHRAVKDLVAWELVSKTQHTPTTCDHCALPIPPADLVSDVVAGMERRFCCQGCRGAYRIITGAGLERFYRQRDWQEPGLPDGAYPTPYDDAFLARFAARCRGGMN